jgi:hypothetical protein
MGEDFLRRRTDGFRRRRDAAFARLCERDLFSQSSPLERTQVIGSLVGEAPPKGDDLLWSASVASEPIAFYSGQRMVLQVAGPPAEHIRKFAKGRTCVGRLADVHSDVGIASIDVATGGEDT